MSSTHMWRFGHETISLAILPLLLIQEEQRPVVSCWQNKCALNTDSLHPVDLPRKSLVYR